jgi:periplasmic protein TonB
MLNFQNKYSGLDELVFENRNREYGAYILRKNHDNTVILGLIISMVIGCSIIVVPFLRSKSKLHDLGYLVGTRNVLIQPEHFELPKEEMLLLPTSPPPPTQKEIKYLAPVILDTVPILDKLQITDADKNEIRLSNDTLNLNAKNRENDLIFGENDNGILGTYAILETQPSFKGGDKEKFREWVSRNTYYPKIARDSGIYGKVIVTFIIETDGSVNNVRIIKGVDKIIDDEAIRTIKASPKWSPGISNGRPVKVRCSIPLIFPQIR